MGYVKVEEFTVSAQVGGRSEYYKLAWRANAKLVDGVMQAGYCPVASDVRVTMSHDEAISLRDDLRSRGVDAQAFRTETVEWRGPRIAASQDSDSDSDSDYW